MTDVYILDLRHQYLQLLSQKFRLRFINPSSSINKLLRPRQSSRPHLLQAIMPLRKVSQRELPGSIRLEVRPAKLSATKRLKGSQTFRPLSSKRPLRKLEKHQSRKSLNHLAMTCPPRVQRRHFRRMFPRRHSSRPLSAPLTRSMLPLRHRNRLPST